MCATVAVWQVLLRLLQFHRMTIIPPMLLTHISIIYSRRYITLATDSVVKLKTCLPIIQSSVGYKLQPNKRPSNTSSFTRLQETGHLALYEIK
jgi:hypothetical protein